MIVTQYCLVLALLGTLSAGAAPPAAAPPTVDYVLDVAKVWTGHPVGFSLLTHGQRQFAAFYDAERRMTVASRTLDEKGWKFARLPESVKWDSHNYVTLALDDDGYIHLAGNMHCVPLIYFRTARPCAIDTFERIPKMVGREEQRCTYPQFRRGANDELLFTYRDGSSGNGNQIHNVYDPTNKTWRRLLDKPLTSGDGKMNAYFRGPVRDANGVFHLCWVWRDTPDCATNHDLSYARSKDLVHWETSAGKPLALPITLATAEIVDPVPPGGGMINGNTMLGFDTQNRPIVSYHKFDANGKTQLYNARREANGWRIYQTSDWDYRWAFSGGGSIPFEIRVGAVRTEPDAALSQNYSHPKAGSGRWELDEQTLKPVGRAPKRPRFPRVHRPAEPKRPGMRVRWREDAGNSNEPNVRYVLQWETLGPNRDRPRPGPPPAPTMLRLYKLRETTESK